MLGFTGSGGVTYLESEHSTVFRSS